MESQPVPEPTTAVLPADLSENQDDGEVCISISVDGTYCPILEPRKEPSISVDGTHFSILEPRKEPCSGWYSSKKHNTADGLSYEVGIAISGNTLVLINGPPSSPPAHAE